MVGIVLSSILAVLGVYLFWPEARLVKRKGSVYHQRFDEVFTVRWSFWLFPFDVTYVKADGSYFVVNSHVSLGELGRRASTFESNRVNDLLHLDLQCFAVSHIFEEDTVTIMTKVGAKFDLVREDGQWTFRHNNSAIDSMRMQDKINLEVRKRESAWVVTR